MTVRDKKFNTPLFKSDMLSSAIRESFIQPITTHTISLNPGVQTLTPLYLTERVGTALGEGPAESPTFCGKIINLVKYQTWFDATLV